MIKKILILVGLVMLSSSIVADKTNAEELEGYRCVSNGFRVPLSWKKSSQPRIFSRYRRKAMVDLTGKLKLVFPTFYMDRTAQKKIVAEYPFPNDVKIQAGIEPLYKMSNKNLETSPRIVGETVTYSKGDKDTYKIITVDLGDKVIKKGEWFGIWVVLENLDGDKMVPYSRTIGDSKKQIYECSYTSRRTSFIESDYIEKTTEIPLIKLEHNFFSGYCPIAILAETDYSGDVWAIIGSSIPEGWYDIRGNQYGDENGNAGYADKLFSTKFGVPSVNLSKGADKLAACATELKGRMDILGICDVTKVHIGLGGNDLYGKMNVMEDSSLKIYDQIKAINPNLEVIGGTILPHSVSTNDFGDLEGQTPRWPDNGPESIRGKWNAILRTDCKSVGFDDIFELCSYVEYDWKNTGGKWAPNGEAPIYFTGDGTHPTCAGSDAIAEHAYLVHKTGKKCKR